MSHSSSTFHDVRMVVYGVTKALPPHPTSPLAYRTYQEIELVLADGSKHLLTIFFTPKEIENGN